ncbi:hypothetical protein AB9K35_16940 [Leisingera sp. XS_AS12]|uniref:hypothetical protein n=1 Tax=Leisingera sp. XS_AS12 TaxID=3241294 RepID=UPI003512E603
MVALHNRRLTARDIWPDNIWDWDDELRVSRQIEARLVDEGVSGIELTFKHSDEMMKHRQRSAPPYSEQRKIMARIYPPKPAAPRFGEEELEAIMERFAMANDDLGRQIHEKAAAMLGREPRNEETPGLGM